MEAAIAQQTDHDFRSDLAGSSLVCQAKLQVEPRLSQAILAQAKAIQCELGDQMGEACTLLLEARLASDLREAEPNHIRILELRSELPALAECRLLSKILTRWDQWVVNKLEPDNTGDLFWGV